MDDEAGFGVEDDKGRKVSDVRHFSLSGNRGGMIDCRDTGVVLTGSNVEDWEKS